MASLNQVEVNGVTYDIVGDELAQKANIDGAYEGMTVGNAEQLVSNIQTEDTVPFNFRTSGGTAEIGDREYLNKIVGGTYVVNQIFRSGGNQTLNGITFSHNNLYTNHVMNGTSTAIVYKQLATQKSIIGHVYYVDDASEGRDDYYIYNDSGGVTTSGAGKTISKATAEKNWYIRIASGVTFENYEVFPQIIDLTIMLGANVADHIASLATRADRVAWFKKYFPQTFIPFTAPTMQSVYTNKFKTTGFNQWDEEWEVGNISAQTGNNTNSTTTIRSKNYIRVIPDMSYYFKSTTIAVFYEYDADKRFITAHNVNANSIYTPQGDVRYIRFRENSAYGTTYNNDICINFHWDGERDGEYEPHVLHEYELDEVELRGITKIDSNGNLYHDGDEYMPDGTVNRRYAEVDLGTLNWSKSGDSPADGFIGVNTSISSVKAFGRGNVLSESYTRNDSEVDIPYMPNLSISGQTTNGNIYVRNDSVTTAQELKNVLSGVYAIYELATPTTEEAEPYHYPMVVSNWGTEEFVDAKVESGERDVAISVGHETKYPIDMRAKLEAMADNPDSDGVYLLQYANGVASYTPLASNSVIVDILNRLSALEGEGE